MIVTRQNPAGVVLGSRCYWVYPEGSLWFFQPRDCPEAGWTCASADFSVRIEAQLTAPLKTSFELKEYFGLED
jgi:hypothetical protein